MSITKRMIELDEELPEVDAAAFSDPSTCEVDDNWLRQATHEQQAAAMEHWLRARYCDPAYETPYASDAGGYIFTRGGPWHPNDVLMERFEDIADFDTIEALAHDIVMEIGDELAPTALTAEDDWDVDVETADSPLADPLQRVADLHLVLAMEGPEPAKFQARNLVYAALITALETFLWETAAWWLSNEPESVERLIAAKATLDQRLRAMVGGDELAVEIRRAKVHQGMKDMVWHRWRSNWPFLAALLGVEMPAYDTYGLTAAALKRHDIVHRSGQNKDRTEAVYATTEQVRELSASVVVFAEELRNRIAARGT